MMKLSEVYFRSLDRALEGIDLSFLAGKTVLITGASGLIGSSVADLLIRAREERGSKITIFLAGRNREVMAERFSGWRHDSWSYVSYDSLAPLDFDFVADFVIHCASNAHPIAYSKQPVETAMINVIGTNNLLEYVRGNGVGRFLYVSSSEVYGKLSGMQPYAEQDYALVDPLDSRSCYPNSKRLCETLCCSYLDEYGVDAVIVRPGHVFGPMITEHDSRAHAQFLRKAAAGEDIVLKSPGDQVRSYMYATDCAVALLNVLGKGRQGEAYNIGYPDETSTIKQLAEVFAQKAGVEIVRDVPTKEESKGYSPMPCAALNCQKLSRLGFKSTFGLEEGAALSIQCLQGL